MPEMERQVGVHSREDEAPLPLPLPPPPPFLPKVNIQPTNPNPFLDLLSKFQFTFPFMGKKHDGKASDNGITGESATAAESGGDKEDSMAVKPAIVRFPLIKPEISMKIEGEEASERDSNPLVLWQEKYWALDWENGFFSVAWLDLNIYCGKVGKYLVLDMIVHLISLSIEVYALGGYLIGKWIWSKLQERKAGSKKNSSGEDQSLSNE